MRPTEPAVPAETDTLYARRGPSGRSRPVRRASRHGTGMNDDRTRSAPAGRPRPSLFSPIRSFLPSFARRAIRAPARFGTRRAAAGSSTSPGWGLYRRATFDDGASARAETDGDRLVSQTWAVPPGASAAGAPNARWTRCCLAVRRRRDRTSCRRRHGAGAAGHRLPAGPRERRTDAPPPPGRMAAVPDPPTRHSKSSSYVEPRQSHAHRGRAVGWPAAAPRRRWDVSAHPGHPDTPMMALPAGWPAPRPSLPIEARGPPLRSRRAFRRRGPRICGAPHGCTRWEIQADNPTGGRRVGAHGDAGPSRQLRRGRRRRPPRAPASASSLNVALLRRGGPRPAARRSRALAHPSARCSCRRRRPPDGAAPVDHEASGVGAETAEALERPRPDSGRLASSTEMPRMNGWAFVRRVEELPGLGSLPILVMSGIAAPGFAPPRRNDAGFLKKPLEPAELLNAARRSLAEA